MKRKILALLLAAATLSAMLTGCLEEDGPKTTGDAQGSESSPVSDSDSGHKHVFSGEDDETLEISMSSHTFTCAECGELVKEKHEYKYVSDVNGHRKECVCKKTQGEYVDHIMSNGKCTKCGWQEDPNHTHSFTVGEQIDDSYHSVSCQCGRNEKKWHESTVCLDSETDMHYISCVCGWKGEQIPHDVFNGVCVYCDEMGVTHHCDFNKKGYDEDYHFLECECGERSNFLSHNFGNDYDGKPYMIDEIYHSVKCVDCDYVHSEKHSYNIYTNECICQKVRPESVGLELEEYEGGYAVIGIGSCTDKEILIPSTHNGKPVVAIGVSAFERNTSIEYVIIPDSVTTVGSSAFAGCTSLKYVVFPDGVTTISDNTFMGSTSLESIIARGVTEIEMYAFVGCSSFKGFSNNYFGDSYYIPSVTIGDYAFKDCKSIADDSIEFTDVQSIGNGAFSGCTSIKSVTFHCYSEPIILGGDLFSGCTSLNTVVFYGMMPEYFEIGTFSDCTSLQTLRLCYGEKDDFLELFAMSTVEEEMGLSWYDGCPDFTVEFMAMNNQTAVDELVESIRISDLYDYVWENYEW